MIRLIALLSMLNATYSFAALFSSCQILAVKGAAIHLQAKKNSLFFVHNTSSMDVWVTYRGQGEDHLISKLQANNWSALGVNKGSFTLGCIESKPGHEQEAPCEGLITLCVWKKAKLPASGEKVLWLGEDMSLSGLKTSLGGKAIIKA